MAILDSTIIKGDLKVLGKIKEYDNDGVIFSTAEQVYGTWIDGKTVYVKTFQYTSAITASTRFKVGDIHSAVDTVVKVEYAIRNSGNEGGAYNYNNGQSTKIMHIEVIKATGVVNAISGGEDGGTPLLNVTVYYTKQ